MDLILIIFREGNGLTNMKERARELGFKLNIYSDSSGTTIETLRNVKYVICSIDFKQQKKYIVKPLKSHDKSSNSR